MAMNKNHEGGYNAAVPADMIAKYLSCLENLDPAKIHRLKSFWDFDIILDTPLLHAEGRDHALSCYARILAASNMQRMKIISWGMAVDNPMALLIRWEQKLYLGKKMTVMTGMSDVTWREARGGAGVRVVHQQDVWNPDPVLSAMSPLYRFAMGRAKRRI